MYVINTSIDVRCPNCDKLLFIAYGLGTIIQIMCPRCRKKIIWPCIYAEMIDLEESSEGALQSAGLKRMLE